MSPTNATSDESARSTGRQRLALLQHTVTILHLLTVLLLLRSINHQFSVGAAVALVVLGTPFVWIVGWTTAVLGLGGRLEIAAIVLGLVVNAFFYGLAAAEIVRWHSPGLRPAGPPPKTECPACGERRPRRERVCPICGQSRETTPSERP